MSKPADVKAKAAALEPKLKGKLFLGGDVPTAEDVKAFNDMLGDKNTNVFRWVKHMASFTDAERAAWGAAGKKLGTSEPKKEEPKKEEPKKAEAKPAPAAADDDDDIDLFGEETEEEKAAMEAKKKADADAKAAAAKKKPAGKSSIVLDVKAWEDTCDLEALAAKIKAVEKEGLSWGAHKLTPVAFGVKKLTMMITIIDDLVPGDDLEDIIMQFEDDVQSMDIVAWNKL